MSVESHLTGDDAERFRGLLPKAQRDVAEICNVECSVTSLSGYLGVTVRFFGRRGRDGQRYARPVNHWSKLNADWLPWAFPDSRVRGAAAALLRGDDHA